MFQSASCQLKCFNFKLVTFFHCVHLLSAQLRALAVVQCRGESESEDMAGDSKRRKQDAIQKRVKANRAGLDSSEGEGVCVCVCVCVCAYDNTQAINEPCLPEKKKGRSVTHCKDTFRPIPLPHEL